MAQARPKLMVRAARLAAVALATLGVIHGPARAAEDAARPEASRRIVKTWDFDDRLASPDPVPLDWFRAQDNPPTRLRPGFPAWNVPALDETASASGAWSIMLPTQGGSTSIMLAGGVIPAIPEGDYVVRAKVRTQGLVHARARLAAWFLNDKLERLPGPGATSRPALTEGAWETLEAELRGDDHAAWIQIELQLLQPAQLGWTSASPQRLPEEDFRGAAWFDDLVIAQVPRLDLRTDSPDNIIVEPDPVGLVAFVRDLTGERLTIDLKVFDIDGAQVAARTAPQPSGERRSLWAPRLPAYGWYRAVMTVLGSEGSVGQRSVDFVWSPRPAKFDRERSAAFGLIAEDLDREQRRLLPRLATHALSGAVSLSVWDAGIDLQSLGRSVPELAKVADQLLDGGTEVTFVLGRVPDALAKATRADEADPLPIFLAEDDPWKPYLSAVLTKYGERVRRWQMGGTGRAWPFYSPTLAADVGTARAKLRRMIPRPMIALPWVMEQPPGDRLGETDGLTAVWPASAPAQAVEQYAKGWPDRIETRLVIEPTDELVFGRRATAVDLARKASLAWSLGFTRLGLLSPWTFDPDDPTLVHPRVELAVWRTLSQQLSGRRFVGPFPAGEGLTALIVEGPMDSTIIAWNDHAPPERATLRAYLGGGDILLRDPFGNAVPAPVTQDGLHEVALGDMPVFIEGIDAKLAQFRAALRVEPNFVPARAEKHQLELAMDNPWSVGIAGRVRISEPESWTISPRVIPFNLGPGKSMRLPLEVSFTMGEEAGRQRMLAEVEVVAERKYPVQRIPMEIEIGLQTVELLPSFRYEKTGDGKRTDVVVTLLVTNLTDKPITMEAFAQAPGYKAFSAPISQLDAGASITRRFRFEGGGDRLKGKNIRVGLKEQDGTGRLNKVLSLE